MILDVKIKTPFKGCRDCAFLSPDQRTIMKVSPENEAQIKTAWVCKNENKCKHIVRKAIGDDEFERLINEVAE